MNNNLNNTNPLSSWIRPCLAIVFGLVLAMMLIIAFSAAVAAGNWQVAVGLLVMAAVPPFWYFNIRSGDKAMEKMLGMFQLGSSSTSQGSQGAAAAAAPPEAASPPSLPPAAPPPVTVVEAPPEPLDIKAFHNQVLADVGPRLGEVNPYTVFSEARDKGSVTDCLNINQAEDYWDYLVPLAYAAEAYVKEHTEGQTAAAGGCKGVAAPEYVAMQLELAKTLRNQDNVYALVRSGIDWKTALGPNATLYKVGVLAAELLQRAWKV